MVTLQFDGKSKSDSKGSLQKIFDKSTGISASIIGVSGLKTFNKGATNKKKNKIKID